jgi:hypothetical protein
MFRLPNIFLIKLPQILYETQEPDDGYLKRILTLYGDMLMNVLGSRIMLLVLTQNVINEVLYLINLYSE